MSPPARDASACPHRSPIGPGGDDSTARCGIVARVLRTEDPAFSRVGRDACEACCRGFAPTAEEFNPVVASLVYEATTRIAELGGIPGCDAARARVLNQKAVAGIPDEEDCEIGPTVARPGSLFEMIPSPSRKAGPRVARWAVGVTTAPRAAPTLAEGLASLAAAGWDRPRLFVDGDVAIPEPFSALPRTVREPLVGAWPSYYLAVAELLMREPEADAYLLVQDDVLFAEGLDVRGYLERVLWPRGCSGIASLFCSRAYSQPRPGWARFRGAWVRGAQAFAFSPESARAFVADLGVVEHRRRGSGLTHIDACIGEWAVRRRMSIYFPTPSLVQHIGEVSTLWPGERAFGNRRASWFASR
ncbi:hypothetical protein TA3x_000722 [Tundrisphaera sp. TA3]|uniref:hypothetical protein n=1 Tax=Tundrisphaera sp. TA3 TaxID=3435775 RepID=UPI003EBD0083